MKAFRIAVSYLLVFCMAVSCASAAFADPPVQIDADGVTLPPQDVGAPTDNATGDTDALALNVSAENGGSATVSAGTVTATAESGSANSVVAQAEDGSSVNMTIGNITSATNSSDINSYAFPMHVTATGSGSATVTAGTVTATAENGRACGVVTQSMGEESTVNVTTDSINATASPTSASADNSVSGIWCVFDSDGETTVTVNGDLTATGKADTYGVEATESNALSVTVNGDVSVASSEKSATGFYADYLSVFDVTVTGNVDATAHENACGVSADFSEGAAIRVDGNVTATSDGWAGGISYAANGDGVKTTVTVGGDVIISAGTGAAVALDAGSGNAGEVTVEGIVSATSKDSVSYGMHVISGSEDSTLSVSTGDITSTGKDEAHGIQIEYAGGSNSITVNGDVSAETKGEKGIATAVSVEYSEGTAGITVNGDITAKSAAAKDMAIGINAEESSGVDISVTGNVDVTGNDYAIAIEAQGSNGTIRVDNDVNSTAAETSAHGINLSVFGKEMTVSVGGNVSAESANGVAVGVDAAAGLGGKGTAIVEGSVSADAGSTAYGIYAGGGKDAPLTISTGDVASTSANDWSYGVFAWFAEGSTGVTVNGDITAKTAAADGLAAGIYVEDSAGVDVAVTGKVDVTAQDGASGILITNNENGNIRVDSGITASAETGIAEGIFLQNNYGTITVTSGGDISAVSDKAQASGIDVCAYQGSEGTVTAEGSISAKSEEQVAYGVIADAWTDSKMTVTVEGTVTAESAQETATGVSSEASHGGQTVVSIGQGIALSNLSKMANGIDADAGYGGKVDITVESGGIYVTAEDFPTGISARADTGSSITMDITGDVVSEAEDAVGIIARSYDGAATDITVHGNVTTLDSAAAADPGFGILATAEDGAGTTVTVDGDVSSGYAGVHVIASESTGSSPTVLVDIAGDLKADKYGIIADKTGADSDVDLNVVVVGTLHADESPVLVGKLVDSNDLNLTIWQIDIPDDDNIIEQYGSTPGANAETKELEQNIHYIIKVDPPAVPAITLNGTFKSNGWETAKENEIVTLKPKPGYELLAAYNGLGVKIPLMTDKDGNYYLAVPRGGGVYLSVDYNYNEPFKAGPWWYGETAPVTVSFDLDGGKIGEDEGPIAIDTWIGNWIYLPEAPEKEGAVFQYWKEILPEENEEREPLQYKAGQSYQVLGDTRFIAVWDNSETL